MKNELSQFWLSKNFDFNSKNVFHLFYIKKSINNFIRILTKKKYKLGYKIYPTPKDYIEDSEFYISTNIPNVDVLLGQMFYKVARHESVINFDNWYDLIPEYIKQNVLIKHKIKRDELQSYLEDKILTLINVFLKTNAIIYISNNAEGFIKYIKSYFDNLSDSKRYEGLKSKCNNQIFINNNWDSYFYYILNIDKKIDFKHEIIVKLKHECELLTKLNQLLTKEFIIERVSEYFELLDKNSDDSINDYDILTEPEESKLNKTFEELKNSLYNEYGIIGGITPKEFTKLKTIDVNNVNHKSFKSNFNNEEISILEIDNFNMDLITYDMFKLFEIKKNVINYNRDYLVTKGISLGKKLLNQLKYRDEITSDKITHLKSGKIDRNKIYQLGMDKFDIFYNIDITENENKTIYISYDASKSMNNEKWDNSQIFLIGLIYAISNISSLNIKVFYRMTTIVSNGTEKEILPVLLKVYDSETDKFNKVKLLFPYLKPNGGSPEGILHELLKKKIAKETNESIMINISDGKPNYYNHGLIYTNEEAILHTKKQIDNMKQNGVQIISYFIGDKLDFESNKKMYGKKNSFYIELDKIVKLGDSLNELAF
jgi:hypothetical protein